MLTDEMHARTLLAMYQGWFGSPVVVFRGKVIDGRKRLAAWEALMFNELPPTVNPSGVWSAARYLCAAEHHRRAADLLDGTADHRDVQYLLHLPEHMCTPLINLLKRRGPWTIRRAVESHRPRRRTMQVVKRVRRLYVRAVEDGAAITPEDLQEALEEWVDGPL